MLKNESDSVVKVEKVCSLEVAAAREGSITLGKELESSRIYLDSNNLYWSGVKRLDDTDYRKELIPYLADIPDEVLTARKERLSEDEKKKAMHESGGMGLVYNPTSGIAFLAGYVTAEKALAKIVIQYDLEKGIVNWHCTCKYDRLKLMPGEELSVEKLYLDFRKDPLEALETYGDALAVVNDIPTLKPPLMLWCSWYCYRLTVTEEAVLANAKVIAEQFKDYGVDVLQIDFGWNWRETPGEWRAHKDRFLHGMRWLSEKLNSMGLKLGLWAAPFYIGEQSSFFREHPECLLKNPENGKLVSSDWKWNSQPKDTWQKVALLDTTKLVLCNIISPDYILNGPPA